MVKPVWLKIIHDQKWWGHVPAVPIGNNGNDTANIDSVFIQIVGRLHKLQIAFNVVFYG